jgi:hypothetical protein
MCKTLSAAVTVLTLAAAVWADEEGESPPVRAARARQEMAKTLDIEFKQVDFIPQGALSDAQPKTYGYKAPWPAKDVITESINRLVIAGEKVRFEYNHPVHINWHSPDGRLTQVNSIAVYDGTVGKVYYPRGLVGQGNPTGQISNGRPPSLQPGVLTPIAMTYRGVHSVLTYHPVTGLRPVGNTLPIEWSPCQEYEYKFPGGNSAIHCWLDTDRDFVIRRWGQTDIRYQWHHTIGWVPNSWTNSETSVGIGLRKVDVLKIRLNEPQPADLFDLQFPVGCDVYDGRDNKDYRVQSDGSMGEVDRRTGKVLSQREPESVWYWRYRWLLGGFGVVCAGAVWQYIVRRKRRRRGRHTNPASA